MQQRHRLGQDRCFTIELLRQIELSSDTLEITIGSSGIIDEEFLQAYLEGLASGGGQDKEVEFIKRVRNGVYHVRLSSAKGTHAMSSFNYSNNYLIAYAFEIV